MAAADNRPGSAVQVKVVLIEYHHIQTDVANFKSVVHRLTGNQSCTTLQQEEEQVQIQKSRHRDGGYDCNYCSTSFAGEQNTTTTKRKRRRLNEDRTVLEVSGFDDGDASTLLKGLSFKDLDGFLNFQLDSIEDPTWIWPHVF